MKAKVKGAKPRVSVIIPVYNGSLFLREAIESILKQTYTDFECIIVDDGSADDSVAIVESFKNDSRVVLLQQQHGGIVRALNAGIRASKGIYIARMDADDIAEPRRLEKQVRFLEESDACLCGTYATLINKEGAASGTLRPPTTHTAIVRHALLHNPFIHPTVMMRRSLLEAVGFYREKYRHVEDYELWTRILPRCHTANIPETLLQYRVTDTSVTRTHHMLMRYLGILVRILYAMRRLKALTRLLISCKK